MNGTFFFRDGDEGTHTIELRILPHGEVEVEETFVVELMILSGDMDIDRQAGSVKLKVFTCFLPQSLYYNNDVKLISTMAFVFVN